MSLSSLEAKKKLLWIGDQLEGGLVPLSVYNDPEIYQVELEQIFAKTWVYMGHESEVSRPGDYVQRYIGEDPFILVRDGNGKIQVLYDSCRHHGARVCPAESGNASRFQCPYHGWVYKNTGELIGVPNIQDAYDDLREEEWGLHHAPRVDSYKGLIFASLSLEGQSLDDYLGNIKWYLDINLDFTEAGMEVVGKPQRWIVNADWKSAADNFVGDSYHTQTAHQSAIKVGLGYSLGSAGVGASSGIHVICDNAHTVDFRKTAPKDAFVNDGVFFGYPREVVERTNQSKLSQTQRQLVAESIVCTGNLFPNLSYLHVGLTDSPNRPVAAYFRLCQWQPKGPGKLEAWNWILVPKDATDEYKERAYRIGISSFGPAGTFEADDTMVWSSVAKAAGGVFARKENLSLNYRMGKKDLKPANDWVGPGRAYQTNLEEVSLLSFYKKWYEALVQ